MREVTLEEVLTAREGRVRLQEAMIALHHLPLISYTMNIAGPVKTGDAVLRAFEDGRKRLEDTLPQNGCAVRDMRQNIGNAGYEAVYAIDGEADVLKKLCTQIEDGSPAGRLFDMDVIGTDGRKLSRSRERGCIVCGRAGRYCASRRIHSVEELQAATGRIIRTAFMDEDGRWLGERCTAALVREALTTPKPGLVDRNNSGSHKDMDLPMLQHSAAALEDYFRECFFIGVRTREDSPGFVLPLLREAGLQAEEAMYAVTGGVNTHKGSVFHFGLISAAAGRIYEGVRSFDIEKICGTVSLLCGGILDDFAKSGEGNRPTSGEEIYRRYGLTGARGEALSGFASVREHALPVMRKVLAETGDGEKAGCLALLALIAGTEDTNMIRRGGKGLAEEASVKARELLESGRTAREDIEELDRWFIERNLSPGGCADLLAVTYLFTDLLKE